MGLIFANLRFAQDTDVKSAINDFIGDRTLVWPYLVKFWSYLQDWVSSLVHWIEQPQIYSLILVFVVTFTVIVFLALSLGAGPAGVVAGSAMAGFQSYMYGGFTPAAGIFATLTSMGMTGLMAPVVFIVATVLAAAITTLVAILR